MTSDRLELEISSETVFFYWAQKFPRLSLFTTRPSHLETSIITPIYRTHCQLLKVNWMQAIYATLWDELVGSMIARTAYRPSSEVVASLSAQNPRSGFDVVQGIL